MPHVHVTPYEEATGLTKREYEAAIRRAGRVWNIVSIQSQMPAVLRDSMRLYRDDHVRGFASEPGPAGMIAVVTSSANDCFY